MTLPQFALTQLEAAVAEGCQTEEEWPARVSAGIYAGIDFAIENRDVVEWLGVNGGRGYSLRHHQASISRLAGLLRARVPNDREPPVVTGETLIGGLVFLVGEELRAGRVDRLRELRPEFVLLTLLPYLGFEDARRWANRAAVEHG